MQEAFGYVIFAVAILGGVLAVASLAGRGRLYDEIGRGGLSIGDEPADDRGGTAERDAEIRQMLAARNARRAARGDAEGDVEAELTRPQVDPALREEIRDHVLARNARRVARGKAPLDVESEIERGVRDLAG